MIKDKYTNFLVRTKENKLFKITYDESMNIYFEDILNNKIINKEILYKNAFKYFYIFEDSNRDINFIYQDIFGNININILTEGSIKHKDFFSCDKNFIIHLDFKGIYLSNAPVYFYKNDIDNKIYLYNNKETDNKIHLYNNKNIIYNNKDDIYTNYKVFINENFISLIIYSISVNIFKLLLKTYNKKNKAWSNEVSIFITDKPYIDMSFCISNNKLHSLIIINEGKESVLIYKYNNLDKDIGVQREVILCEYEDISSCLLIESNNIIWLFWISRNKMYYCKSTDFGENFSEVLVYLTNIDDSIRKINFIDSGINKETYISEKGENIILILDKLY